MCEVHLLALQECGAGESVEHASLVSSLSLRSLRSFMGLFDYAVTMFHIKNAVSMCSFSWVQSSDFFLFLDFTETFLHQNLHQTQS